MIIAIDGTSGSGKSTVAKLLAENLSFELLNTGLIYRKITKECLDKSITAENTVEMLKLIDLISFNEIEKQNLHTEEISKNVPEYAKNESVRKIVRTIQRNYAEGKNIIVEGRDIGSVVFPNAEIKLFIDASIEVRTQRRMKQLNLVSETDYKKVLENLEKRDNHDENRENSPLVQAEDAILIDTSTNSIEEVMSKLLEMIKGFY